MNETFRSRFGLIVALVGMAVGTGNIWRFPRVMSQNGGGAFLIPWVIFLALWSIPLLTVEFSLGQKLRRGPLGAFYHASGGRLSWLGGFVVLCTLGIMFYYSVVTAWCLYYLSQSVTGALLGAEPQQFWDAFTGTSRAPLLLHAVVIAATGLILTFGVRKGIERVSVVLIPALFLILGGLAVYAQQLTGAPAGREFIFDVDWSRLGDYKVWLEALTQSAWSTGAGWGLALTYAAYARDSDHPVRTPVITGLSNNMVELMAVLVILPTLFSFFPLAQVLELTGEGNTGLTFIALPGLFRQMPQGQPIAVLFFLALFFAAFTSLMAMYELGVSFLGDLKVSRRRAIVMIGTVAVVLGAPSAVNMSFFDNQDWVWGVGLLVSGLFFSLLVRAVGADKFATEYVGLKGAPARRGFKILMYWVVPLEFAALVVWWFWQAAGWDPEGFLNPFKTFSIGTCLVQWGILLAVLLGLNKFLNTRMSKRVDSDMS